MLEDAIIADLALKLRISQDRLAVEAWEILLLKELFSSSFASVLILKGGTAIRLAYGSPRFSEDLDFSLKKKIMVNEFSLFLKKLPRKYPEFSITDLKSKYYTLFALLKIKEPFLQLPFAIKLEISQRKIPAHYQTEPKILTSPTSSLEVLATVATMKQIKEDKRQALKDRLKPRDLFDLWYLSERLKEPMNQIENKMEAQQIKQELHRFLPKDYQPIVSYLMRQYGKNNRKTGKIQ